MPGQRSRRKGGVCRNLNQPAAHFMFRPGVTPRIAENALTGAIERVTRVVRARIPPVG
jgi:hypothetical protein